MIGVVINGLIGEHNVLSGEQVLAGIQVSVIAGKVAAGDLEAEAMPFAKQVRGCPKINLNLIDFAWNQSFSSFERVTESKA